MTRHHTGIHVYDLWDYHGWFKDLRHRLRAYLGMPTDHGYRTPEGEAALAELQAAAQAAQQTPEAIAHRRAAEAFNRDQEAEG